MSQLNFKRLATPSFVAAIIAASGLALTAACGNNNADNGPRITGATAGANGLNQSISAGGCPAANSYLTVNLADPSIGVAALAIQAQLSTTPTWSQTVSATGAGGGVRQYAVQTLYNPSDCRLLTVTAWGPSGSSVPSDVRAALLGFTATASVIAGTGATVLASGQPTANYTDIYTGLAGGSIQAP
jgi:hypothetical protein